MSKLATVLASLVALLVLVGAGAFAPSARAAATAKPCWERVLDDWLDNGTIDGTYTPACYQAALKQVPEDLRDYTNIADVITTALQRSLRGQNAGPTPPGTGGGVQSGGSDGATHRGSGPEDGAGSGGPGGTNRTLQVAPKRSYYRRTIDNLGSTSAQSVPIPLLVLAGLGTALLLTAGGLAARQRLRARGQRRGTRTGPTRA